MTATQRNSSGSEAAHREPDDATCAGQGGPVVGSTPEELIGSASGAGRGHSSRAGPTRQGQGGPREAERFAASGGRAHHAEPDPHRPDRGQGARDLTAAAALFGEKYEGVITQIIKDNPKLGASAAQIEAAGQALISAANDAASAGVDFKSVANDGVLKLDKQLDSGKITVRTYATEIGKLTKQLLDMTEAAKEAAKHKVDPVEQFKQRVFGAEGFGANKLGSSAFGFGQFMPATFEHYYRQAYGNPGNLANSDIDKLRNDRTVVAGVIEVAAKDYAEKLKAAGVQITAGALYAFHMLSAGTSGKVAIDLLTAPGSASARSIVGNKAVAQNGNIFTGTVDQARAELAKRIGDSSTAVSAGAVAIAAAAEKEKEAERKYGDAVATVESQILSARKELGLSAQETADIETAAAKVAHDRYEADVKQLAAEGKIRGDVTALLKKNDDLEKARLTVIQARLQAEKFAEQQEATSRAEAITSASFSIQEQLLQSQEGLARTAGERRAIEQRLLDLQYTQEKTELQSVIANAARLKTEADLLKTTEAIKAARDAEAQAAIARLKLGTLDQRHADATAGNNLQNASPLRAYLDDIPDTAKRIDQALEQVAANGLQNFVDGIADAVVHFKSLGDVGLAALQGLEADLIKLALRLVIANTLGKLFGDSFKSGGDSAAKAAADAAAKVAAVAAQQLVLQAIQTSAGAASAAASIAEGCCSWRSLGPSRRRCRTGHAWWQRRARGCCIGGYERAVDCTCAASCLGRSDLWARRANGRPDHGCRIEWRIHDQGGIGSAAWARRA
jgi:hypothetical protein